MKKQYAGKFFTAFEQEFTELDPGKRAVSRANSGLIFQAAQLISKNSCPLLALFYADASFAGQNMTHHPIYSMYFEYFYYCDYCKNCDYSR